MIDQRKLKKLDDEVSRAQAQRDELKRQLTDARERVASAKIARRKVLWSELTAIQEKGQSGGLSSKKIKQALDLFVEENLARFCLRSLQCRADDAVGDPCWACSLGDRRWDGLFGGEMQNKPGDDELVAVASRPFGEGWKRL